MLGKKGETQPVRTLTVTGSSVAIAADGQVAIVLDTTEGPRGFLVSLEACAALRRDIAVAETALRQQAGQRRQ